MGNRLVWIISALLLASCSGRPESGSGKVEAAAEPALIRPQPRMMAAARPLECVTYARQASGIDLRGDAWTWWRAAEGRYRRDKHPKAGAVLVFRRQGRSLGHLAVVTAVLSPREIVAQHANWLNRGQIHLETPVIDVSPQNDWSAVRVWYVPGGHFGSRVYAAHGFIHPDPPRQAAVDHPHGSLVAGAGAN